MQINSEPAPAPLRSPNAELGQKHPQCIDQLGTLAHQQIARSMLHQPALRVFQVQEIDVAEKVIVRKQLRRSRVMAFFEALAPCFICMEACATAHHWARELTKLGHEVGLNAGEGCKGLRQAQQERCRRRRGDLRGGPTSDHTFW